MNTAIYYVHMNWTYQHEGVLPMYLIVSWITQQVSTRITSDFLSVRYRCRQRSIYQILSFDNIILSGYRTLSNYDLTFIGGKPSY